MFFVLSKLVNILIMPLTWITATMVAALIFIKKRIGKKLLVIGIGLIFLFGNEFLVNEIYLIWEEPPIEFEKIDTRYDIAIILGGVTKTNLEPRDRVHFDRGADRVVHPLFLYKMGKIDKFLVSGGTGRLINAKYSEAPSLAMALEIFGVPKEQIIIEDQSRNTRENAIFSKKIIDSLYNKPPKILVVTSAFHMPRSKRCFNKINLDADFLTTDFLGHPREFGLDTLLFPQVDALMKWSKLFKEWVGTIAYKVAGYI